MKPLTRYYFPALFALAAALRVAMLWAPPLWYDESFTILLARLPFARMIEATAGDVHPPLWYLLTWLIARLPGMPDWAVIRLPALGFSLACLPLYRAVLRRLALPEKVQAVALTLMAVAPLQVYYAQEGRMYALLEFLVLAMVWGVLYRRPWLYGLAALAMLYTQNYAVFYLPVIWLWAMLRDWRVWKRHTLPLAVAGMLWLPWFIGVTAQQMDNIHNVYWIVRITPAMAVYALHQLIFEQSLNLYLGIFISMAWISLGVAWTRLKRPDLLLLTLGPILAGFIFSLVWQPVFLYRAMIGCAPWLYILLAGPVEWLTSRRRAMYAACFLAPMWVLSLGMIYAYTPKDNAAESLAYIRAHWQPGDVVYATNDGPMINWMAYAPDLPLVKSRDCAQPLGALTDQTRRALGYNVAEPGEFEWRRLWVVYIESPLNDDCERAQYAALTVGPPAYLASDDQFIRAGVWLVEK